MQFIDLKAQYLAYQSEIDAAVRRVLDHGGFIRGPEVGELEQRLATYTGAAHCIACGNGTDALSLALMALGIGPGDEVITSTFTFISSAETVALVGATPVFADIEEDTFNLDAARLEAKITPRTKAVIPVSLFGQTPDMDAIQAIAERHGLTVIEDAAQSFGALYKGRRSCNLSRIACTSFFPAKPLGCYGDGGAVFTSDEALAEKLRALRDHGQTRRYHYKYVGVNSRLDTLQAAILLVKLAHFDDEVAARQAAARRYGELLGAADLVLPRVRDERLSVFAQYTIRVRDRERVAVRLRERGVPTGVYYPVPLHLQEAFETLPEGSRAADLGVAERVSQEVLSLPMSPFLGADDQSRVAEALLT